MSNIEEDIKYIRECLKIARVFFKVIKTETDYKELDDIAFCVAIENILAERETDKKKIKELEEVNKKYIVQLTDEQYRSLVDTIRKATKQEFEQKVKDKIEELENAKRETTRDNWHYIYTIQLKILEELLEENK